MNRRCEWALWIEVERCAFYQLSGGCGTYLAEDESGIIRDMKSMPIMLASCLFAFLLGNFPATPANALAVDGLYDQELTVQSQSNDERLRAYREGLGAVILKITGAQRWLSDATVERALRDAQSYVQEVSYSTRTLEGQSINIISIRFDQSLVDGMLRSAGIPVWDRNRPSILLWLTVQNADGSREMIGSDSDHPVLAIIRDFAEKRGVPILIPLMDLEDRRNLPLDVAWSLDEAAIRRVSARYGADSILGGRVLASPTGELVGMWQFLFRDNVVVFDSLERNLETFMQTALDRSSSQLAEHFAQAGTIGPSNQRITLRVDGVEDIRDYVDLLAYLQEFGVVESLSAALLDGSSVELDLSLSGTTFLFTEFLSLGRDLLPNDVVAPSSDPLIASSTTDSPRPLLHYRWVR